MSVDAVQLAQDSVRVFGESHPVTRVVRDNLQQAHSHAH